MRNRESEREKKEDRKKEKKIYDDPYNENDNNGSQPRVPLGKESLYTWSLSMSYLEIWK